MRKFATLALAAFLMGCGTSDFKTDLADSEIGYAAAQQWWITNCIDAQNFKFCTDAATKAKVKAADLAATKAFQTASDAALNGTVNQATIATYTSDAIADMEAFTALINGLKGQST